MPVTATKRKRPSVLDGAPNGAELEKLLRRLLKRLDGVEVTQRWISAPAVARMFDRSPSWLDETMITELQTYHKFPGHILFKDRRYFIREDIERWFEEYEDELIHQGKGKKGRGKS